MQCVGYLLAVVLCNSQLLELRSANMQFAIVAAADYHSTRYKAHLLPQRSIALANCRCRLWSRKQGRQLSPPSFCSSCEECEHRCSHINEDAGDTMPDNFKLSFALARTYTRPNAAHAAYEQAKINKETT
uniref:Chromatin structure-remodeling complex subunit rsc9 n=1 Tax=Zeugodacus cucurbitae TaxID=28588 RepID=A0A0A1XGN3_ZEUCU